MAVSREDGLAARIDEWVFENRGDSTTLLCFCGTNRDESASSVDCEKQERTWQVGWVTSPFGSTALRELQCQHIHRVFRLQPKSLQLD